MFRPGPCTCRIRDTPRVASAVPGLQSGQRPAWGKTRNHREPFLSSCARSCDRVSREERRGLNSARETRRRVRRASRSPSESTKEPLPTVLTRSSRVPGQRILAQGRGERPQTQPANRLPPRADAAPSALRTKPASSAPLAGVAPERRPRSGGRSTRVSAERPQKKASSPARASTWKPQAGSRAPAPKRSRDTNWSPNLLVQSSHG